MYQECWRQLKQKLEHHPTKMARVLSPAQVLAMMLNIYNSEFVKVQKYQREMKEEANAKAKKMDAQASTRPGGQ